MGFSAAVFLRNCALALFGLTMLSACTVEVDQSGPGPQYCSREYNPVCARRGGDRRTFANSCLADQAGFDVIRRGECGGGNEQPRFCTKEYNPVCARRGGDRRTFANGCLADQAGFDVIRQGECSGGSGGGNEQPRSCTREYNPVCARRGDDRRTFSNGCLADQAGYDVIRQGECRSDGGTGGGGNEEPRFCTKEYRPVCARRNGALQTFGNECEADAAGWRVVQNGPC